MLLKRFFDGAKTFYTSLLILKMEQPFPAINALPKSFFLPLKHAF
jgi:hypothetical protein